MTGSCLNAREPIWKRVAPPGSICVLPVVLPLLGLIPFHQRFVALFTSASECLGDAACAATAQRQAAELSKVGDGGDER